MSVLTSDGRFEMVANDVYCIDMSLIRRRGSGLSLNDVGCIGRGNVQGYFLLGRGGFGRVFSLSVSPNKVTELLKLTYQNQRSFKFVIVFRCSLYFSFPLYSSVFLMLLKGHRLGFLCL